VPKAILARHSLFSYLQQIKTGLVLHYQQIALSLHRQLSQTLNNMETLQKMPFTDRNPAFMDLIDLATYDKMIEDEQIAYDRSLKCMWDYDAVLDGERYYASEEGYAKGHAITQVLRICVFLILIAIIKA